MRRRPFKLWFPWRAKRYLSHLHWIDRERLYTAASRRGEKICRLWFIVGSAGLLINTLFHWFAYQTSNWDNSLISIAVGAASLLALFGGVIHSSFFCWRYLRLSLFKNHIRPRFCFVCDYDLEGTTSKTCPECGGRILPKKTRRQSDIHSHNET